MSMRQPSIKWQSNWNIYSMCTSPIAAFKLFMKHDSRPNLKQCEHGEQITTNDLWNNDNHWTSDYWIWNSTLSMWWVLTGWWALNPPLTWESGVTQQHENTLWKSVEMDLRSILRSKKQMQLKIIDDAAKV